MEIKEKTGSMAGMTGWLIKDANISIGIDEVTGTQSVVCFPDEPVTSYEEAEALTTYLSEDELKLLKKIFRIEE